MARGLRSWQHARLMCESPIIELASVKQADLLAYARSVALGLIEEGEPEIEPPDCGDACSGAFVALRRGSGTGCFVGSLARIPLVEAVERAVRLAVADPRCAPSMKRGDIEVDVWLTGSPRKVNALDEVGNSDGVLVASGFNRATYLPGLPLIGNGPEGVLATACVCADLHPGAWLRPGVDVQAFTARLLACPEKQEEAGGVAGDYENANVESEPS